MSKLVTALFGGESDKGIKAQEKSNAELLRFMERQQSTARTDIRNAMPSQFAAQTAGQQAGLDVYGQTMPQQANAFVGGNVAAQNSLLSGMPMYEQAIRGTGVNYGGLQPYEGSYDMSFAQQQLPDAVANPAYLGQGATNNSTNNSINRDQAVNALAGMGIDPDTLAELQAMGRL